ncbi:hypothetical protein CR162_19210 [Pseudoroseomonas rhizosphaerae]|uniref:Uncharacterized protein n=1 Tax=Teichococcus rhizosphaerae TaxID=1335062 RepID=A0A2C6XXP1_9PROT|nr:hypothetical protein [Pseudoroseomonas rhizosphaerae]PHK93312.1 hypothetical protein CR162_19210 [Pseudoroseomonas rhizosphaerae]
MTPNDNLRVLRQQAMAARRIHIAQTLGITHEAPSTSRLPELQRMISGLDAALELPSRPDPEGRQPRRA